MIRTLWQDFQAWRRGESRIASRRVRGRVYEKRGSGGAVTAAAKLKPSMTVRIYRAATKQWEDGPEVK